MFDEGNRRHLVKSIIEHLYCSGLSHVANELEIESGYKSYSEKKEKYLYLTELLTDLRNGKNQILLNWVYENRKKLKEKNSFIEWKIRRLEFCQKLLSPEILSTFEMIKAGRVLAEARCDTTANQKELQQLMTAILYRKAMKTCPYESLIQSFMNSTAEVRDLNLLFSNLMTYRLRVLLAHIRYFLATIFI